MQRSWNFPPTSSVSNKNSQGENVIIGGAEKWGEEVREQVIVCPRENRVPTKRSPYTPRPQSCVVKSLGFGSAVGFKFWF